MFHIQPTGPKIACFLHLFVSLCVPIYHVCNNNYVMYIVVSHLDVVTQTVRVGGAWSGQGSYTQSWYPSRPYCEDVLKRK